MHFLLFKQIESLLNLVTELLAISKAERDAQESVINRQTALYSLKLLSRLLAKDHPNQFKDVSSCSYCSTFGINSTLAIPFLVCLVCEYKVFQYLLVFFHLHL